MLIIGIPVQVKVDRLLLQNNRMLFNEGIGTLKGSSPKLRGHCYCCSYRSYNITMLSVFQLDKGYQETRSCRSLALIYMLEV